MAFTEEVALTIDFPGNDSQPEWWWNSTWRTVADDNSREPPPVLDYMKYAESRAALALLTYVTPLIVFAGTLGNLLAFCVLLRHQMRRTSVYVYLACLAWADTAVLYLSAFKTWVRLISGWELLHVSAAGCKMLMFVLMVVLHVSAWLIVAMSVDRLIAVLVPLRASSWCSPRRARLISLILFFLFCLAHIFIFWKFQLQYDRSHLQCAGDSEDYFIRELYPWLRLITYSLIPFGIIIVLNVIIIMKLALQRPSRQHCSDTYVNSSRSVMLQQNKLTVMLLSVSFVWLLLSTPFTIWRLVLPSAGPDQHHRARIFLARTVCFILMWLNHAINFGLYCLTGKKFRRELVLMLTSFNRKHNFHRQSSQTIRTQVRKTSAGLVVEHLVVRDQST